MSDVTITVSSPYTALQTKLMRIVGNEETHQIAHELLGEMCNDYVPQDTGALRLSMEATPYYVRWDTPYARYQYEGEVYGPNKPITVAGTIVGWYTPAGAGRHPLGRELGVPGTWRGWTFGYTEPGTGHHWFDKAMAGGGRRRYSLRLTNRLKKEAARLSE